MVAGIPPDARLANAAEMGRQILGLLLHSDVRCGNSRLNLPLANQFMGQVGALASVCNESLNEG